jgi:hypothetical protein
MSQLGQSFEKLIIPCPKCRSRVAVPAVARGTMAKCVRCKGIWRIPLEDVAVPASEAHADEIAIEILEQEVEEDDGTVVMESVAEGEAPPAPRSILEEASAQAEDEPPDIGDESTPEEAKTLRRERYKLLLEIGREANEQILSSAFNDLQARIKKIEKHVRRQRAWLSAVDRASDANPITRRMEVTVDVSAAAHQLAKLEKDRDHVLRVLAEALIRSGEDPRVCASQRERVKVIDGRLAILVPLPAPKKKGLFARLRRE